MGNREEQFGILENFKAQVSATWDSPYAEGFSGCFLFTTDFSTWVECLKDIPQSILLKSSLNECATANLFCSQGLYKHAMISLRLCLEHCLYAIHMSSNDFYFRRWKAGQEDMKWAAITDGNTGIFSKSFIRAYAPEFEERSAELNGIASNVYRECSEYIHGNYSKINCLPGQNEFNQDMLSQYISRFQSISYLLSIALVIRFKEQIVSKGLLPILENAIMHNIGMLPEIQLLYGRNGD
ncbi:hypothetical protein [uncultured Flavonifractor sp.]|uniref:hypothetical protein n=1 Tax=uncultured Flavonifractor sp. TaxID=1193534 RepID=UPI002615E5F8|nr:hypothetical protein [uncultured Flavonifractor sp.]